MNRIVYTCAAVLAIVATSVAYAQSRGRIQTGPPKSNTQISAIRQKAVDLNPAQRVLSRMLVSKQQRLLDATSDRELRAAIILEHCTVKMWLMDAKQQDYSKNVVMQIDKYRPSPSSWDQVRRSPSRVDALLKLTKDQSTKITAISAKHNAELYKILSTRARDFSTQAWRDELAERYSNETHDVYAVLTRVQKAEWDQIMNEGFAVMEQAATRKR